MKKIIIYLCIFLFVVSIALAAPSTGPPLPGGNQQDDSVPEEPDYQDNYAQDDYGQDYYDNYPDNSIDELPDVPPAPSNQQVTPNQQAAPKEIPKPKEKGIIDQIEYFSVKNESSLKLAVVILIIVNLIVFSFIIYHFIKKRR